MTQTIRKRLNREESRAQTRVHLLEAAEKLFAQKGFEATSVEDVAETAGYSRGALYSNYTGKEELLTALIAKCFERDIGQVNRVLEGNLTVLERHHLIVNHLLGDTIPKEQLLLQHEFRSCSLRYEAVRQVYTRLLETLEESIGTLIERHARDLGLSLPLEGKVLASTLTSLRNGMTSQHYLFPERPLKNATADLFYRLLGTNLEQISFPAPE